MRSAELVAAQTLPPLAAAEQGKVVALPPLAEAAVEGKVVEGEVRQAG